MKTFALPILLGLAGLATARTDLSGCISSATRNQWNEASMIWYVPDTGEICDFVDCGGGRAPPKTTQPGCPLYTGTATVTPSYLPGWGPNGKLAASTTTVSQTTSSTKTASTGESTGETTQTGTGNSMVTAAPTSSPVVSMTTTTSSASKIGNSTAAGNSTSSAATAVHTGGASGFAATNLAGVVAIVAAAVGAVAL
jgi:hypothetical protein